MSTPPTAPPSRDELRLTPSVERVLGASSEPNTASEIAARLLEMHSEYTEGRPVKLNPARGPSRPTVEWLAEVQELLAAEDARLHGRLVILGLGRLDEDLRAQLEESGLANTLERQLGEPLDAVFRQPGRPADAAPPAPSPEPEPEPLFEISGAAAADLPASADLLGFAPLVRGLAAMLDDAETALPLAVAITGKWGAGKSSVMRQLAAELQAPERHRSWTVVRFDAWKYERSERLWAALAKAIYDQALDARSRWRDRQSFRVRLEWRRLGPWRFLLRFAWPALVAAASIAVLLAADLGAGGRAAGFLGLLAAGAGGVARYWRAIEHPFKRAVERHASHPDYEEHLGFTSEADHDIACLTATAAEGKDAALAIFIDDLDRCSSTHLVEVVEAINQVFNSDERTEAPCVFVLGIDRELVASTIEAAYGTTVTWLRRAGSPIARDFGMHFIDKLVQLSVSVPQPPSERLRGLLLGLDRGVAREAARMDPSAVADAELRAVGNLAANPRQAKRFHNVFRLQVHVAEAEGVALEHEQLVALARWVALRVRWPALAHDLDDEPGLLRLLEGVANEEKLLSELAPEEQRLHGAYRRWFDDGQVTGVLLVSWTGAPRVAELPLDEFLTVA